MDDTLKPVVWVGSAKRDLLSFPQETIRDAGHALYLAQNGDKPPNAKPLKGFGSGNVLEIVLNEDSNTYRAVYTIRFELAIYVLHCFQKKSKSGIATPHPEIELIKSRLKIAEEDYKQWQVEKNKP